jgi:hypothetical protein
MVKGFNHETDNELEVAISLGMPRNANPPLPVDITEYCDLERKIMMPDGSIETTARVRKAVVTLEMDSAATVEITMIPEHS